MALMDLLDPVELQRKIMAPWMNLFEEPVDNLLEMGAHGVFILIESMAEGILPIGVPGTNQFLGAFRLGFTRWWRTKYAEEVAEILSTALGFPPRRKQF